MPAPDLPSPERWAPLVEFVSTWYARPLQLDGNTEEQIVAAEARLGGSLPAALREWYRMVGHRLQQVNQDSPVELERLELEDGCVSVWWENQGNWSVEVKIADADADPWATVDGSSCGMPSWDRRDRLSRALIGMTISDTLVGAWGGHGMGPLGELRSGVSAGMTERPPLDDRGIRRWPILDVFINPNFDCPLRGRSDLIIRGDEDWLEWMTASVGAHRELAQALGLSEPTP